MLRPTRHPHRKTQSLYPWSFHLLFPSVQRPLSGGVPMHGISHTTVSTTATDAIARLYTHSWSLSMVLLRYILLSSYYAVRVRIER